MPNEVVNKELKFRFVIYHGHLHKIPIDDESKDIEENELITTEE